MLHVEITSTDLPHAAARAGAPRRYYRLDCCETQTFTFTLICHPGKTHDQVPWRHNVEGAGVKHKRDPQAQDEGLVIARAALSKPARENQFTRSRKVSYRKSRTQIAARPFGFALAFTHRRSVGHIEASTAARTPA